MKQRASKARWIFWASLWLLVILQMKQQPLRNGKFKTGRNQSFEVGHIKREFKTIRKHPSVVLGLASSSRRRQKWSLLPLVDHGGASAGRSPHRRRTRRSTPGWTSDCGYRWTHLDLRQRHGLLYMDRTPPKKSNRKFWVTLFWWCLVQVK